MESPPTREDLIIGAYADGVDLETIKARYGADRSEVEALVAGIRPPASGAAQFSTPVTSPYGPFAPPGTPPSAPLGQIRWPLIVGAAAAYSLLLVGLGAAGALFMVARLGDRPPLDLGERQPVDSGPFIVAQARCDPTRSGTTITDDGRTLLIDGVGAEDPEGIDDNGMGCLLIALNVPDAVGAHIATTRTLEGHRSDRWPGFSVSWSYHPDEGLEVVMRAD